MMDEKWFPRFAEIPGIQYEPPKGLDFSYLPGRGKVPEISYYNFDGKRRKSVMWKSGNGTTSASPAHEWETVPRPDETEAATLLRQLYETLELPGNLSDYHFALQNTHEGLNKYIGKESWVLAEIEKLCWLNIRLLEKYPETISYENDNGVHYAGVLAFNRLISLYENEGYLRDALEVAKIAARFDYGNDAIDELEERIRLLESEDEYA
ncbi:MAG: hypothetical protein WA584_10325 [Pyrinomonadaceae bacterium]